MNNVVNTLSLGSITKLSIADSRAVLSAIQLLISGTSLSIAEGLNVTSNSKARLMNITTKLKDAAVAHSIYTDLVAARGA